MKFLSLVICLLSVLASCTNSTKNGKQESFDSGTVFYDYKIWGEEGNDSVTILLQYRMGNEEGPSMFLDSGNKVMLDGKEVKADSAKLAGVFYETMLPAGELTGIHKIAFTDKKGKERSLQFSFTPFSLATELPPQIKMEPFVIRLNGFTDQPIPVQFVMIDTAFNTKDVNEELMIENGELVINAKMWRALKPGPIALEISREQEVPGKKESKHQGRLIIAYRLKREFEAVTN